MSTIKGELLPFVVKKQLSKYCKNTKPSDKVVEEDEKPDIFNISRESDNENNVQLMSCFGDIYLPEEKIKCYACIMDSNIGIRANTLYDYYRVNKIVSNLSTSFNNKYNVFCSCLGLD